jgi:hypothetical protein
LASLRKPPHRFISIHLAIAIHEQPAVCWQFANKRMSINRQLAQLYSEHWDDLIEHGAKLCPPVPTNPMLLQFDEVSFSLASKRILISGQESTGSGLFGTAIHDQMEGYYRFFIQREFYPEVGRSAFWKAFRYFEREFRRLFGEHDSTFIYQNLSKMGRYDCENGVTPEIRQLERDHFAVLRDEMAILQPDIVLFLTGPNRDEDIRFHFPDVQLSPVGTENSLIANRGQIIANRGHILTFNICLWGL